MEQPIVGQKYLYKYLHFCEINKFVFCNFKILCSITQVCMTSQLKKRLHFVVFPIMVGVERLELPTSSL